MPRQPCDVCRVTADVHSQPRQQCASAVLRALIMGAKTTAIGATVLALLLATVCSVPTPINACASCAELFSTAPLADEEAGNIAREIEKLEKRVSNRTRDLEGARELLQTKTEWIEKNSSRQEDEMRLLELVRLSNVGAAAGVQPIGSRAVRVAQDSLSGLAPSPFPESAIRTRAPAQANVSGASSDVSARVPADEPMPGAPGAEPAAPVSPPRLERVSKDSWTPGALGAKPTAEYATKSPYTTPSKMPFATRFQPKFAVSIIEPLFYNFSFWCARAGPRAGPR